MTVSAIPKPAFRASRTITGVVYENGKVTLKCGFLNVKSYDANESTAKHIQSQVAKAIEQKGHIQIDNDMYCVVTNKPVAVVTDIAQMVWQWLEKAYTWCKAQVIKGKDWVVFQYNQFMIKVDVYRKAFTMSKELAKGMTKEKLDELFTMLKKAGYTTETV